MINFFTYNPFWHEQIGKIYALLERVKISEEQSKDILRLRRNNRILTIGSTTAIEGNRLTTQQVFDVINGKIVFAPLHDIKEVKNAFAAYEQIPNFDPYNVEDFLKAHSFITENLVQESGMFRSVGDIKNKNIGFNDPVNGTSDPVNDPVNFDYDSVNDPVNSFDVLELIKSNPSISYDKLVEKTGRSRATIKRMIKRLKQEGFISRIGSDKTGYWNVNKNINNETMK